MQLANRVYTLRCKVESMLYLIHWFGFNWLVLLDPERFSCLKNKLIPAVHSLYWQKYHVTVRVASHSKMHSHWLLSVELTLLCHTAQVLTEPGFGWPTSTPNVLNASQLGTHSCLLGAGHTINHTRSVTRKGPLDGVGFTCEVAGVCCGVGRVGTHTTISSLSALVESLLHLSSNLPWLGRGDFGSH